MRRHRRREPHGLPAPARFKSIYGQPAGRPGKIISLAQFVKEHREAVAYDLLTKTGHDVSDLGSSLTWDALQAFLRNLGADSATARDLNPELAAWSTTTKTNALLADIFDLLAAINANLIGIASRKRAHKPKPYPRPGQAPEDEKKIGKGAMPVDELRKWIAERQNERND